jgi:hypothetical protein
MTSFEISMTMNSPLTPQSHSAVNRLFFAKIGFSKKNNVLHFFKYNSINESKREDLSITLSSSPNYELDSDGVFNCFEFVKDQT